MSENDKIYAADVTVEQLAELPRRQLVQASPSQVNTFRDCERKWFFNKVLGIREPQSAAARQGTQVHKELEELTLGLRTPDQLSPEAAELVQYLPEVQEWINHNDALIQPLVTELQNGISDFTLVEPHFVLAGGAWPVPVQGYIDRFDVPHLDLLEWAPASVIDYKTTSNLSYVPLAEDVLVSAQKVIYTELAFQHPEVRSVDFTLLYVEKRKHRDAMPSSRRVSVLTRREEREDPKHGKPQLIADLNRMVQASGLGLKDTKVNTRSCSKYNGCPYQHLCDRGGKEKESFMGGLFKSMTSKSAAIAATTNAATKAAAPTAPAAASNPMLTHNPGTVFQQKGTNPFAKTAAPAVQPEVPTAAPEAQPEVPAAAPKADPFAKAKGNPFAKKAPAPAPEPTPAPAVVASPAGDDIKPGSVYDVAHFRKNAELRAADGFVPPEVSVPKGGKAINRAESGGRRTDAELYRDRLLCLATGPDGLIRWGALSESQVRYCYDVQEWYPVVGLGLPEEEDYQLLLNKAPDYTLTTNAGRQKLLSDLGTDGPAPVHVDARGDVSAQTPQNVQSQEFSGVDTVTQDEKLYNNKNAEVLDKASLPNGVAELLIGNDQGTQFTLYVGCIPYAAPFIMLHDFLRPVFEDIEQFHKSPYWNLQEFGKGKQELAGKVKLLVEARLTDGTMPNICVPAVDASLDEAVAVLRRFASEIVQRC